MWVFDCISLTLPCMDGIEVRNIFVIAAYPTDAAVSIALFYVTLSLICMLQSIFRKRSHNRDGQISISNKNCSQKQLLHGLSVISYAFIGARSATQMLRNLIGCEVSLIRTANMLKRITQQSFSFYFTTWCNTQMHCYYFFEF